MPTFPVLRETPDWLAIDKPPAVVVVPARSEDPRASLWRVVERERGERLWVVHRLDRHTSGVVLFARSAGAHRTLCLAFERGEVRKTYLALTRGAPQEDEGVIDAPLHGARRGKMRPALPGEPGALAATTEYRVLRRWAVPSGCIALLEVRPRTGRLHQVRVHLRYAGAPLLGDSVYGRLAADGAEDLFPAPSALAPSRLALHASRLEFPAPGTGEWVVVDSPLPGDLQSLMAAMP
jgi:RluA family pseudouridine synthase